MRILRIFFKILLFPISLLLTAFVAISMFLVERCAGILNIFSGIMFLAALVGYSQYLFGRPFGIAGNMPTLQLAIFGTVFAFILSPYAPVLARQRYCGVMRTAASRHLGYPLRRGRVANAANIN